MHIKILSIHDRVHGYSLVEVLCAYEHVTDKVGGVVLVLVPWLLFKSNFQGCETRYRLSTNNFSYSHVFTSLFFLFLQRDLAKRIEKRLHLLYDPNFVEGEELDDESSQQPEAPSRQLVCLCANSLYVKLRTSCTTTRGVNY